MNEQQMSRSEKIATQIMRILAIIGVIAVTALAAWLVIQGVRFAPHAGENLSAAVSTVRTVLRGAPSEVLTFAIDTRTLSSGAQTTVSWRYTGDKAPNSYTFSYACSGAVSISVKSEDTAWTDLPCETPFETKAGSITLIPSSPESRFADVAITVTARDLSDTTLVTIVNTDAALSPILLATTTSASEGGAATASTEDSTDASTAVTRPAVPPTQGSNTAGTVVRKPVTRPTTTGPSDLRVNIEQTGVVAKVKGEDTFFPLSPIPDDRTAAVRFTVSNLGGQPSGPWAFIANLPIEGEPSYRYVSPAQDSLAPGMELEFTLSFDEVLHKDAGTIRIEVVPTNSADPAANNVDALVIDIRS